jgi:DNA replication protein DnaC
MTTYVADRLYSLINGRYEKGNTLIVTSQSSPSELERKLEYALCSRLYEMCMTFDCTGFDNRNPPHKLKPIQ